MKKTKKLSFILGTTVAASLAAVAPAFASCSNAETTITITADEKDQYAISSGLAIYTFSFNGKQKPDRNRFVDIRLQTVSVESEEQQQSIPYLEVVGKSSIFIKEDGTFDVPVRFTRPTAINGEIAVKFNVTFRYRVKGNDKDIVVENNIIRYNNSFPVSDDPQWIVEGAPQEQGTNAQKYNARFIPGKDGFVPSYGDVQLTIEQLSPTTPKLNIVKYPFDPTDPTLFPFVVQTTKKVEAGTKFVFNVHAKYNDGKKDITLSLNNLVFEVGGVTPTKKVPITDRTGIVPTNQKTHEFIYHCPVIQKGTKISNLAIRRAGTIRPDDPQLSVKSFSITTDLQLSVVVELSKLPTTPVDLSFTISCTIDGQSGIQKGQSVYSYVTEAPAQSISLISEPKQVVYSDSDGIATYVFKVNKDFNPDSVVRAVLPITLTDRFCFINPKTHVKSPKNVPVEIDASGRAVVQIALLDDVDPIVGDTKIDLSFKCYWNPKDTSENPETILSPTLTYSCTNSKIKIPSSFDYAKGKPSMMVPTVTDELSNIQSINEKIWQQQYATYASNDNLFNDLYMNFGNVIADDMAETKYVSYQLFLNPKAKFKFEMCPLGDDCFLISGDFMVLKTDDKGIQTKQTVVFNRVPIQLHIDTETYFEPIYANAVRSKVGEIVGTNVPKNEEQYKEVLAKSFQMSLPFLFDQPQCYGDATWFIDFTEKVGEGEETKIHFDRATQPKNDNERKIFKFVNESVCPNLSSWVNTTQPTLINEFGRIITPSKVEQSEYSFVEKIRLDPTYAPSYVGGPAEKYELQISISKNIQNENGNFVALGKNGEQTYKTNVTVSSLSDIIEVPVYIMGKLTDGLTLDYELSIRANCKGSVETQPFAVSALNRRVTYSAKPHLNYKNARLSTINPADVLVTFEVPAASIEPTDKITFSNVNSIEGWTFGEQSILASKIVGNEITLLGRVDPVLIKQGKLPSNAAISYTISRNTQIVGSETVNLGQISQSQLPEQTFPDSSVLTDSFESFTFRLFSRTTEFEAGTEIIDITFGTMDPTDAEHPLIFTDVWFDSTLDELVIEGYVLDYASAFKNEYGTTIVVSGTISDSSGQKPLFDTISLTVKNI